MKPEVSIVIPSYNVEALLPEAVQSVIEQPFQNWEIIIVNDGSKDATGKVADDLASQDSRIKVVHQTNKGLSGARNTGIKAATADYILPLDADNKITEAYLVKGLPILQNTPEVHMVYGDIMFFGAREKFYKRDAFSLDRMLQNNYIDACALYRKSLWETIGGYDENMRWGFEDWDFWLTAQIKGCRFQYLPELAYYYRYNHNSMLRTTTLNREREIRKYVYEKHKPELEKWVGSEKTKWIIYSHYGEHQKKQKFLKKVSKKVKLMLGIKESKKVIKPPF